MGDDGGQWRPWRELRARSEIEFELADLPAGLHALWCRDPVTGVRAILINRSISQVERLAALAHELVHDERSGSGHRPGLPAGLQSLVAQEELQVDRIAATRLLPATVLQPWIDREVALGHQVTAETTAERWEVPVEVASLALLELRRSVA